MTPTQPGTTPRNTDDTRPDDELAGVATAAGAGAAIGAAGAFIAVTALLFTTGSDTVTALGAGAFAAVWGGIGLGAMLGASRGFTKRAP